MVTCSGVGKIVYVKLTADDKRLLDSCMDTPQQTSTKLTLHWIRAVKLWWKRRSFNKQDWNKPLCLRGVKVLSDSDQGSLKYKDKLQVST